MADTNSDKTPGMWEWQATLPTLEEIQDHKKDVYAKAFGRDPGEESAYWDNAILTGHHTQGELGIDQDWKQWLTDSIHGSKEFKTQGPGITPHDWERLDEKIASSGGGGYSGPSMNDIKAMMEEMFSSYKTPWTPYGYGWGGTNADAVRINSSQKSRFGTPYAGNKSSFNRSGSRLNSGTPWMNTLGM